MFFVSPSFHFGGSPVQIGASVSGAVNKSLVGRFRCVLCAVLCVVLCAVLCCVLCAVFGAVCCSNSASVSGAVTKSVVGRFRET